MAKHNRKSKVLPFALLLFCVACIACAVVFCLRMAEDYRISQEKKAYPMPEAYRDLIAQNSEEYGIPQPILYAVIRTESAFDAEACSHAGAMGLMQLMPDTFTWLQTKTKETLPLEALYDPAVNIKYGCYLLRMLYAEFGVWDTVFAAYNAGMNRVRSWLSDPAYASDGKLHTVPIAETENYIKKVNLARSYYETLYFQTIE